MGASAVYSPSGSSNELQFVNSSGIFDASQCIWDPDKVKLTISGSLEVLGTEVIVDTQHLQVEDTIIGLGTGSAGEGTPADRGMIFLLGGETNPAFYWDESEDEFRLSRVTNTPGDATFNNPEGVGEGGYQNLKIGTLNATSGGIFDSTSDTVLSDIGTDTFFYVSGTKASKGSAIRGTATFGGDVVISGSLSGGSPLKIGSSIELTGSAIFTQGLSGSLTHLSDGSSYIKHDDGITVSSSSAGNVTLSLNRSQLRVKKDYFVTSSHGEDTRLSVTGVDFQAISYDPQRADVYVNGQLMTSGSSNDYTLSGDTTGIEFKFGLEADDIISVITY
jgi:hypothetical protein